MSEFHALHHADKPLLLPNAWDYASAAALVAHGFPAIGTTSLGVAAAAGLPDGAGATRDQTVALARRLGDKGFLFSVDIEGGFSDDPDEVGALARELADAGAAGVNVEDGRADGTLTPIEAHTAKIAAIRREAPVMFINARTDTYWWKVSVAETATRLAAYRAAGADGVFVPGQSEPGAIAALVGAVDAPLNVLYSPAGPSLTELGELGVARVSLGSLLFRVALDAAIGTAVAIRASRPVSAQVSSYADIVALI
jgi:2-methylisocitrate lyase-like PEP mutase family enzyme